MLLLKFNNRICFADILFSLSYLTYIELSINPFAICQMFLSFSRVYDSCVDFFNLVLFSALQFFYFSYFLFLFMLHNFHIVSFISCHVNSHFCWHDVFWGLASQSWLMAGSSPIISENLSSRRRKLFAVCRKQWKITLAFILEILGLAFKMVVGDGLTPPQHNQLFFFVSF